MDAVGVEANSSEEADEMAVMVKAAVAATMIRPSPKILSMELTFRAIHDILALGTRTTLATTAGHTSSGFAVDASEDKLLIMVTETPAITHRE